jgi:hypothetical protein
MRAFQIRSFVPQLDSCIAANLFDHLVGGHEQICRMADAEQGSVLYS